MAGAESFTCPECGGPLTADGNSLTVRCPFCGTSVIVPESLRPKPAPAPQQAWLPPTPVRAAEILTPVTRRKRSGSGCLLLAAVILGLAGFGLFSRLRSSGPGKTLSQFSGLVVSPTIPAFQKPLEIALPRQVSYGGMVYMLTKGVIDNQDDSSGNPINLEDSAFVRLFMDLQNTTRESLFLDSALFKLRLADGKDYLLDSHTILRQDFIAPGPKSSGATIFIFPVPKEADWKGATLTIASPDGEPAVLPLDREAPPPVYPLQVPLPEKAQVAAQGLDYILLGASLDLDSGSRRADIGKRFLKLEVRVSNSTARYGDNVSSSNFRLIVNDISVEPVTAPIEVVNYNASISGEVVFIIPAQAQTAILQVGGVTSGVDEYGHIPLDLGSAMLSATGMP